MQHLNASFPLFDHGLPPPTIKSSTPYKHARLAALARHLPTHNVVFVLYILLHHLVLFLAARRVISAAEVAVGIRAASRFRVERLGKLRGFDVARRSRA